RRLLVKHLKHQSGHLLIPRQPQRNELVHTEFVAALAQFFGQHPLISQLLFETDQAVLHAQGKETSVEHSKEQCGSHQDRFETVDRKSRNFPAVYRPPKINDQHRQREKMEQWNIPSVIRIILLGHSFSSGAALDSNKLFPLPGLLGFPTSQSHS